MISCENLILIKSQISNFLCILIVQLFKNKNTDTNYNFCFLDEILEDIKKRLELYYTYHIRCFIFYFEIIC